MKFCHRLKIYLLLQKLVDEGRMSAEAVAAVKLHHGAAKSVTQFSEAIRLIPNHPSLHPLPHCDKIHLQLHLMEGAVVVPGGGVVHKLYQLSVDWRPSSGFPLHQG